MDHLISDGTSVNLFLRDLLVIYASLREGGSIQLPAIRVQFPDYASWQSRTQESWIAKHESYWRENLAACEAPRFPHDPQAKAGRGQGWDAVLFRLDKCARSALLQWSRQNRTTLVMAVFTAYAAAVMRWCNAAEHIVQYQSISRISSELENTIGYFASPLYLRVQMDTNDTFLDLLRNLTHEYCRAHEHADFFYLATQIPVPAFTQSTIFNWSPLGSRIDLSLLEGTSSKFACSPVRVTDPVRRVLAFVHEPVVRLADTEEAIVGSVFFPRSQYTAEQMQRFARAVERSVRALLHQPAEPICRIPLL
jgi:hypothetical protein